jgi:hypothetical protein
MINWNMWSTLSRPNLNKLEARETIESDATRRLTIADEDSMTLRVVSCDYSADVIKHKMSSPMNGLMQ